MKRTQKKADIIIHSSGVVLSILVFERIIEILLAF